MNPKSPGHPDSLRSLWRDSSAQAVGVVLLAGLGFSYAHVLKAIVTQWWTNNLYSYGFLIPPISLYLIWLRRETIQLLRPRPNCMGGGALLGAGFTMLILGHAGSILTLQELSLPVTLSGLILSLLGTQVLKSLAFPLAYLLFMIPAWEVLTDHLHLPFQLLSATIGLALLQSVGIPAFRDGVYIELPQITLEVAQVCSGVNYLIAVIAIGVPLAVLFLDGWRRRALLLGLSIVVATLSNGLRVALIGLLAYHGFLPGDIHGPFHVLQGILVSMIGYAALFAGLLLLSNRSPFTARP